MEWAVQAAKRKNEQPAGGSRSIVETINALNNIDTRLQADATEIATGGIRWARKIAEMRDVQLLSPEHTNTFKHVEEVPNDTTPRKEVTAKPDASRHELDATPRSVGQQDNVVSDDKHSKQKKEVSRSPLVTRPPWSPYKSNNPILRSNGSTGTFETESLINAVRSNGSTRTFESGSVINAVKSNGSTRTLNITAGIVPTPTIGDKKIDLSSVTNAPAPPVNPPVIASIDKNETSSRLTISSTASLSTTTTKINPHKSPNATINRMKRRSNMFVPLPKKDPLTVHDASKFNQNHTISGTSLRIQKQHNLSPKMQLKTRQSVAVRGSSRLHSPSRSGNVFDRLSSTSTKSFDKKISSRQSTGRKFTASSIDLSGSPMKRHSSRRTSHVPRNLNTGLSSANAPSEDPRMSETLKNIFSTGSENEKHDSVKSTNNTLGTKQTTPLSTVRRSLVPVSNRRASLDHEKRHSLAIGSSQNSRASNASEKNLSIIGEEKSSSRVRGNSAAGNSKISESLATHEEQSSNSIASHKNDHRLTKFQLLRPQETQTDDLKRKLNKRLSEVMKNQQESEKQKKDMQRKKSINTSTKQRTKNYSEFKSFRTSRKLSNTRASGVFGNMSQASENDDSRISKSQGGIDTRNILDALDTGDYRMRVDESLDDLPQKPATESPGNATLPEIFSDSDREDTVTLKDWAKAPYLQEQLKLQQKWDYRKIFGPVAPIHLDEIFGTSRFEKYKSSHTSNN